MERPKREYDAVVTMEDYYNEHTLYGYAVVAGVRIGNVYPSHGRYHVNPFGANPLIRNANDQVEVWYTDEYRYRKALERIRDFANCTEDFISLAEFTIETVNDVL